MGGQTTEKIFRVPGIQESNPQPSKCQLDEVDLTIFSVFPSAIARQPSLHYLYTGAINAIPPFIINIQIQNITMD